MKIESPSAAALELEDYQVSYRPIELPKLYYAIGMVLLHGTFLYASDESCYRAKAES
jgi:hypothetical protein